MHVLYGNEHTCVFRPEVDIRCSSYLWRLDLSLGTKFANWLDQAARELKGPPVSALYSTMAKVTDVFGHTHVGVAVSVLSSLYLYSKYIAN